MTLCPCGSTLELSACCEPFLDGTSKPPTAEALMRSRYSAHVLARIPYLRDTLSPETRGDFDETQVREWAAKSEWLGLEIISAEESKGSGKVEFIARYRADGKSLEHHEIATFKRDDRDKRWYFVDGDAHVHEEGQECGASKQVQYVRPEPKVGRNDPCPCGSGKKFKKCCGK